jgi:outer membrane protein
MNKIIINIFFIFGFLFIGINLVIGQNNSLTLSDAVALVLEENLQIRVAQNTTSIAKENASPFNSDFLPSLNANANANFSNTFEQENKINGIVETLYNEKTSNYNSGISLNYILFDGMGRRYDYKTFKEKYTLSELQTRQVIENTLLQLFSVYYQVAAIEESVTILEQTLEISIDRLVLAERQFQFGQGTKLNVLNAKVDINTDKINFINGLQFLENAKRDLNLILNQPLETPFSVITSVEFISTVEMEGYFRTSLENNVLLLQAEAALNISKIKQKALVENYLPKINLSGSYGWNRLNNGSSSFIPLSNGLLGSIGASMSWSVFDGGKRSVIHATTKIEVENQLLQLENKRLGLEKDRKNQWTFYQNLLQVFEMQKLNVATNEDNFLRSQKNFELGQITAIEYRQAQLNYMSAQINLRESKYSAKLAELNFLQIAGVLLVTKFY